MKNIALLALVGIVATVFFAMSSGPSNAMETQFREFLNTYRVGYGSTAEYDFRLGVFAENMKRAAELSILNPEAEFGVTQFSDRTSEEMRKMMGLIVPAYRVVVKQDSGSITAGAVDWSKMWSTVKHQGT